MAGFDLPDDSDTGQKTEEALAYTFEDSLALENLDIFRKINTKGLSAKFHASIKGATDVADLVEKLYKNVKDGDKGQFALDVILEVDPKRLKVPEYINRGLIWLEKELRRKDEKVLLAEVPAPVAETVIVD